MTEAEWLACEEPQKLLGLLRSRASERKLRLFTVACCRLVWHLLIDEGSRLAVEVAECHADGLVPDTELDSAFSRACDASRAVRRDSPSETMLLFRRPRDREKVNRAAFIAAFAAGNGVGNIENHIRSPETSAHLLDGACRCRLLRDIFGSPFRAITLNPSWLTRTVTSLAVAIYDDRAFDRMPILADALEDAGCTDAGILEHCRRGADHVRGCWVLDLLLAKE
jgi:hypothetical protein